MSPIRLTIALSISIALIGGAMWFRFGQTTYKASNLVAVSEPDSSLSEDAFLADFIASSTAVSTKTTPAKPLSQTDLAGRQLFSDYMALKSQDQVTPSNINALANKYAESLAGQGIQAQQVTLTQIVVVPDTEENLINYSNIVTTTHKKYQDMVSDEYNKDNLNSSNPQGISKFISAVGKLYKSFANDLIVTKVPVSLANNHLELINNYLESAEAMNIFGGISEDPTRIFVALETQTKNSEEEKILILNIQTVLEANGIILNKI